MLDDGVLVKGLLLLYGVSQVLAGSLDGLGDRSSESSLIPNFVFFADVLSSCYLLLSVLGLHSNYPSAFGK